MPRNRRAHAPRLAVTTAAALCTGAILLFGGCEAQPSPEPARVTTGAADRTPAPARAPAVSTQPAAADPELSEGGTQPRLTPDGWGDLTIGISRQQVVAAAGEDANPGAVGGPEPEVCDEFRPLRAPPGMLVMIERDTLTRISISEGAGVETDRGLSVGDSAAVVKRTYGAGAEVTPHKYLPPPAEYITVWAADVAGSAERGIVYETGADGLVMHIHAGGPSIQYVEGCL